MDRFEKCLAFVLKSEGGISNHKSDRGGLTAYGITQGTYDAWLATKNHPHRSVAEISDEEVQTIYRERYWAACSCSFLVPPLDMVVFDSAVQHGPSRAAKWLQNAVGTKPDGAIGNKTISAVNDYVSKHGVADLCRYYMDMRKDFYEDIVEGDPSQAVFAKGWDNRMHHLEREIS